MKIAFSLLCCILISIPTFSWNDRGHMMIAAIAYQELNRTQQQIITKTLITHPEYNRQWKEDYYHVKDVVDLGLYLFMRASVWPDDIKSEKHPDNRSKWHYMNYELRFPYDGEMKIADQENILDAMKQNLRIFRSPDSPSKQKAIALCWLIHLVGDIHQPLHTVSLFNDQFPKGDRGGNSFWIKQKGAVKLHAYWDGLMGRSTDVRSILNEVMVMKSTYQHSVTGLDPVSWSKESFKIAREKVYLNGKLKGSSSKEAAVQVPYYYGQNSKKVGVHQVSLAGYRLAKCLRN